MPDFLCIGAQKAGTSWLHRVLAQHPGLGFPGGKEVHYWDWVESGRKPPDLEGYRRLFSGQPERRLGDMTPAYATLREETVRALLAAFPAVRVLFVLRNPIERAWSAARMFYGWSQLEPDEATDEWFLPLLQSRGSVSRGDYEMTLRRWQPHMRPGQLLILYYEDLLGDPAQSVRQVCEHIGVDAASLPEGSERALRARVREGPPRELTPILRKELDRIYRPRIVSLQRYLGRDLGHWLDSPGRT